MNGILAKYYNNVYDVDEDVSGRSPDLVRVESVVDHAGDPVNFGFLVQPPGVNRENFKAIYSGKLIPLYSETYTITLEANDTARLIFEGVNAISSGSNHWDIPLTAGVEYPITLFFLGITGDNSVSLKWESTSQAFSVVPEAQLRADSYILPDPIPPSHPIVYFQMDENYNAGGTYKALNSGSLEGSGSYEHPTLPLSTWKGFQSTKARFWSTYAVNFAAPYGGASEICSIRVEPDIIDDLPDDWSVESWVYVNRNERNLPVFSFVDLSSFNSIAPFNRERYSRALILIVNEQGTTGTVGADGKIELIIVYNSTRFILKSVRPTPIGEYFHVAITCTSGEIRMYLNGNLEATGTAFPRLLIFNIDSVRVGLDVTNHPTRTDSLIFLLDNFAIFNRALTADEVFAHYAGEILRDFGSLLDQIVVVDSVRANVVWNRIFSETLAISDFKGTKSSVSDTVHFVESTVAHYNVHANFTDDLFLIDGASFLSPNVREASLFDYLILEDSGFYHGELSLTDVLYLADAVDTPGLKFFSFLDNLNIFETLGFEVPGTFFEAPKDTLHFTDSVIMKSDKYSLRDTLVLNDSLGVSGVPERSSRVDTLTFGDSVRSNLFTIQIRETLMLKETVRHNQFKFEVIDPVVITEHLHFSPQNQSLNDFITFNDTATPQDNHQHLTEDLELTDDVQYHFSRIHFYFQDTLEINDDIHAIPSPIRLTDTLVFADVVGRSNSFSLTDTLTLTQSMVRVWPNQVTDVLTLNDSMVVKASKYLKDVLNFQDGICICIKLGFHLQDQLAFSDAAVALVNNATTPPPIGGGGGITIHNVYSRRLSDRIILKETLDSYEPRKQCCGPYVVSVVWNVDNQSLDYTFSETITDVNWELGDPEAGPFFSRAKKPDGEWIYDPGLISVDGTLLQIFFWDGQFAETPPVEWELLAPETIGMSNTPGTHLHMLGGNVRGILPYAS